MKKNLILVATAAVLMVGFTACGDDKGTENNPSDPTNTNKPQLVNGDFEDWTGVPFGTGGTTFTWYPSETLGEENLLPVSYSWDTANEGLGMMGPQNITMFDEADVRPGTTGTKSVKMQPTFFFGKFAAGNIYYGDFGEITTSPLGATVNFGRPFTGRPTALKGWYKAAPGTITHADENPADLEVGDKDPYQIYVMLTNWTEPRVVNTAVPSTLFDFDADYVIGFGEISDVVSDTTAPVADWTEFNIPVVYKSNATPTYIVVVATTCKYGDYFTGSTASVLQVDDFELVY